MKYPVISLIPAMDDYIVFHELRGKPNTASNIRTAFRDFAPWCVVEGIDPLQITVAQMEAYHQHLAVDYRTVEGRPLVARSRATRLGCIAAFYRWLVDRHQIAKNPARTLRVRVQRPRQVFHQPLTLQECSALLHTQAAAVMEYRLGTRRRATALRTLAMLCVALATGRRRSGLIELRLEHIDLDRREVRIEREKSRVGAVVPCSGWCADVLRLYLTEARPRLVRSANAPWLFLHRDGVQPMTPGVFLHGLRVLVARTIRENPDLNELPARRVCWHALRTTFAATLLFENGCDIRTINALLLHRSLSQTATYVPIPIDNLRQAFIAYHPRA